jgi:hypothetical protein
MRKPATYAYFVDPADPTRPIHAKLVRTIKGKPEPVGQEAYAAATGLTPISREEAHALSRALRGQEPRRPFHGLPPPPEPEIAASGPENDHQEVPAELKPVSWTGIPFTIQPTRMDWHRPEPVAPDIERRAIAKSTVMDAVTKAGQVTLGDQMRYELALQAKNQNVRAMDLLQAEAGVLGLAVGALADRIVEDRRTRERRMMHVYAILARASAQIDKAAGLEIDHLAAAAIREIETLED